MKLSTILSCAYVIVKNIIIILVMLFIFGSANNSFEHCVLSLIILIYVELIFYRMIWAKLTLSEVYTLVDNFKKIRILLKEQVTEPINEYEKEEIENIKNKLETSQPAFWIQSISLVVFQFLAVLNLFA